MQKKKLEEQKTQLIQQKELLEVQKSQLEQLSHELEEATHAKLVFFTNISHDFRTPLTLIADPIEQLLANRTLDGQPRQLLELMKRMYISCFAWSTRYLISGRWRTGAWSSISNLLICSTASGAGTTLSAWRC